MEKAIISFSRAELSAVHRFSSTQNGIVSPANNASISCCCCTKASSACIPFTIGDSETASLFKITMPPSSAVRPMASPHQFAPRCWAKRRANVRCKEGDRVAAMCRKACFPARNGVRQYMQAGRPYCMSHGGNVAAGRRAKTRVKGGTPSPATRDHPLRRSLSPFSSLARSSPRE